MIMFRFNKDVSLKKCRSPYRNRCNKATLEGKRYQSLKEVICLSAIPLNE